MKAIAYIDESGSLPDPNWQYVAFVAIVTTNPRELRQVVKKANRRGKQTRLRRQAGREVKWRNAFDDTRKRILKLLAERDVQVFWLIVDKAGQAVPDTPKNYGLMFCELAQECLAYYPDLEFVIDVHFGTQAQRDIFDKIVLERLPITMRPKHIDSQQDSRIQLADFAAGAILHRFQGRSALADLIDQRIVAGKVVKWEQLAKKK